MGGGLTNFPGGVSSFGMPVFAGPTIPPSTGTYFFVDSGTGVSTNSGLTPQEPLATIDQAVNKCTADAGDVVIVFPGHAETISAATSLVLDVNGMAVIGLGWGDIRPTLTFSATASRVPISGDGVLVENLLMVSSIANVVSAVTITGDYVIFRGNEIRSGGATTEFLQFLDIDASTGSIVEFNKLIASSTAGSSDGIRVDATVNCTIRYNEIRGDFTTTAAIDGNVGTGAASTDIAIIGNFIENLDTTAGLLLDMHDSTTGIVSHNHGYTLFATAPETAWDPGNCLSNRNYVVNAVDESGLIIPEVLST